MTSRHLEIDKRNAQLLERLAESDERAREFQAKFEMSLIHHDHALEGVVFSGAELMAALDPTQVPGDASQVPVFAEIRNYRAALQLLREEAQRKNARLNLTLMKRLYEVLNLGFEGREKASYRKEMPLHRTYFHEILQPAKIPAGLEKLGAVVSSADFRELHPVEQAATVQWHFMQVFPFPDSNGKVGRLLTRFLLMRHGYLPVIIHASDRQRYYECFRLPATALRLLVLEAIENSLENAFKFFEDARPLIRPGRVSHG